MTTLAVSAPFRAEPLPWAAGLDPHRVAEAFRELGGLALLDQARPGERWTYLAADPVTVTAAAPGADPFSEARRQLARLDPADLPASGAPPFAGGLVGYLAYDLGRRFERLPALAPIDQDLPDLRLALHDWVIAWDRRRGRAWLAGRAVDGDVDRLEARLAAVRARLGDVGRRRVRQQARGAGLRLAFHSNMDRPAWVERVLAVREAIAAGELYQANLARRLEAPFELDPWLLQRRLRHGEPARFGAFLDLGPGQAIVSASPEPFLAVRPGGQVVTDPIKGTRPRGANRETERQLARELLASAKDRAENVMIVDVLRNDLGRVCRPGSVRVPRLCRLERTPRVQHLVSTVTGTLDRGRDAFHLLAASFPGGSITGAPKIRAMELIESLEPVRRGPYTGALGWLGPDGTMAMSIIIRTLVADGERVTLHVGGGITWRSDPGAEWDETVAKASGPLGAVGAREIV